MTLITWDDLDEGAPDISDVRERFARLIQRVPAKTLARWAGVSPRTAETWREGGALPQPDPMARLARKLGITFLDLVYGAPETTDVESQLQVIEMLAASVRQQIQEAEHARISGAVDRGAVARPGPAHRAVGGAVARADRGASRPVGRLVAGSMLIGLVVGMGAMQVAGDADDAFVRAATGQARGQAKVVRTVGVRDV